MSMVDMTKCQIRMVNLIKPYPFNMANLTKPWPFFMDICPFSLNF